MTSEGQYDADGNLTNDSHLAYAWDCENRMISAATIAPTNGSKKVEYSYDYMGRRSKEVVSTFDGSAWSVIATNISIFDGWHQISEIRSTLNASPSTNYWVWGIDLSGTLSGAGGVGGLLSWVRADTNGVASFQFAYDANGNVTDLTGTNGAVAAHYEYDAFGNTIVATGSEATNNPYRFSTKRTLDGFNIVLYEHRIYLPELGRFGSEDPIGGINFYEAFWNNPLNYVDPDGREPKYWPADQGPKGTDTMFAICSRHLGKPDGLVQAIIFGAIDAFGGQHTYLQYGDCDKCQGWGFLGGKKGALPSGEKNFNPDECTPCKRASGTLSNGAAKGKKGTDATDAEIVDCIKNTPASKDYDPHPPGLYVCKDWANEAAKKCGLNCSK